MKRQSKKISLRTTNTGSALLLTSLALLAPLSLVSTSAWAQSQIASEIRSYNIPAGPLGAALNEFAQQAGIAISFDASLVKGLTTQGLSGQLSIMEGITQLLTGSGLRAVQSDSGYRVEATVNNTTRLPPVKVAADSLLTATEGTQSYIASATNSSTGLTLSPRETPQSISVITRTQMDDFAMNNIDQVLATTTGVTIFKLETDRTYLSVRGLSVKTFQIDGVGMPFETDGVYGDLDTALYDRVEVIRGANGLLNGTGDPSATINLVRKRPTQSFQASLAQSAGSWDTYRTEGDMAGPLTEQGNLRGRLVAVYQQGDSYLDHYSLEKTIAGGILEFDLGDDTLLTAGVNYQNNRPKGSMWGSIPHYYSDGTVTDYDRSTNPGTTWSSRRNEDTSIFAEVLHQFSNDWQAKLHYTHNIFDVDSALFYIYGNEDRVTGDGLFAWPQLEETEETQNIVDLSLTGPFEWFGRQHEVSTGLGWARTEIDGFWQADSSGGSPLGISLHDWKGEYPYPAFDQPARQLDHYTERQTARVVARWSLTDAFKLITGSSYIDTETDGTRGNSPYEQDESGFTYYLGGTYDFNTNLSAYASYTTIFEPQRFRDTSMNLMDPLEGSNIETGLKTEWFDQQLQASIAVFKTEQDNVPEFVRDDVVNNVSLYRPTTFDTTGIEFEVAGEIGNWQMNAGFTHQDIEDEPGDTPEQLFHFTTSYRLPALPELKLGANVRWQSDTYRDESSGLRREEDAYALLDLMALYELHKNWDLKLNVYNVTDHEYIVSLSSSQGYYGPPANFTFTLEGHF